MNASVSHLRPLTGTGRRVRLLGLSVLLMLLIGWQAAAMRHALAHVLYADGDEPALPPHSPCVLCVAYAGADGALPSPAPTVCLAAGGVGTPALLARVAVAARIFLPYQVRAPPSAVA